jgi:hypothetical protein
VEVEADEPPLTESGPAEGGISAARGSGMSEGMVARHVLVVVVVVMMMMMMMMMTMMMRAIKRFGSRQLHAQPRPPSFSSG